MLLYDDQEGEVSAWKRKCRGCEATTKDRDSTVEMRYDAYHIPTGYWCDKCYNSSKYPYRKDEYFDPPYAGESLDPID
jgi:hypothetical protein